MDKKETKQFFECLGEIWRDITAIEFLMRCAITKHDEEESKFPKPSYYKGKIYKNYPKAFSHYNFETIIQKFTKRFPKIKIPQEIIDFRHAMAHGVIAQINNNNTDELIKFKETKNPKELKIEFYLPLELKRLLQIRQSLHEFKSYIIEEINNK